MHIMIRTSTAQAAALKQIVAAATAVHAVRHNLDGLWLNVEYTDAEGDWVASIDRDGNIEATQ